MSQIKLYSIRLVLRLKTFCRRVETLLPCCTFSCFAMGPGCRPPSVCMSYPLSWDSILLRLSPGCWLPPAYFGNPAVRIRVNLHFFTPEIFFWCKCCLRSSCVGVERACLLCNYSTAQCVRRIDGKQETHCKAYTTIKYVTTNTYSATILYLLITHLK
jgi:hypothetical protein